MAFSLFSARRRKNPAVGRWLRALPLALMLVGVAAAAEAGCEPFPRVPWWDGLTHGKTIRYVLHDLNGDWERHIRHFERLHDKLEEIREDNGTAVISRKGIKLDGDALVGHIGDIGERISVIRCLSEFFRDSYVRIPTK